MNEIQGNSRQLALPKRPLALNFFELHSDRRQDVCCTGTGKPTPSQHRPLFAFGSTASCSARSTVAAAPRYESRTRYQRKGALVRHLADAVACTKDGRQRRNDDLRHPSPERIHESIRDRGRAGRAGRACLASGHILVGIPAFC